MVEDISLAFNGYTPFFLFFLVLFVEAGVPIPIPYDILILVTGYQQIPLFSILLAVVLGNIIGSSILYTLSLRFGSRLKDGAAKFFGIPIHQQMMAENWFRRWGKFAIILARLIPGARFATTFLAGSLRLPYARVFLPYLSIGSMLWVILYWSAGAMVGEHIHYLLQFINTWLLILALFLFGILVYTVYKYNIKDKK